MNRILTASLCLLSLLACSQSKKKYESPKGYNFNDPVIFKMPADLKEISGLAFYPGDTKTIYAIQDEDGKLFYWDNGNPESLRHLSFGKHGDYEDIAITKNYTIILRSDGTLFSIPVADIRRGAIATTGVYKDLVPAGEYEGLYADADNDDLYLLCKNCKGDKNSGTVSGYVLHLDTQGAPALKETFQLNTSTIAALSAAKKTGFRPSALALNRQTNEWYLLSSVHKMLIIADRTWKPKRVISLNPALFPQPEGINFDIDNNLYISNEAGNTATGTVLKFRYKVPAR